MSRTRVNDRSRLERAAVEFSSRVRGQIGRGPLTFKRTFQAEETNSDGWFVEIATMGPDLPRLQLWLDLWARKSERNFWGGFRSSKPALIDDVIKFCPAPVGLHLSDDTATYKIKANYYLTKPISDAETKYPIRESYLKDNEFFFGVFELENPTNENDFNFDRIVDFSVQVIRSLPNFRDAYELDRDLEGMPVGRRRQEYLRSLRLAREFIAQRSAANNLICDDCHFNPSDHIDGFPINPRSLLDIHHKNPLAHGERQTEICDLSLLCPTCHRLTHVKMRVEQLQT